MLAAVRDRIDSLLHYRRRRAAQQRLARTQPHSILFICQGNICRSPYAAALLRKLIPKTFSDSTRVSSAGFVGPGRPSPAHALDVAAARGVDLSPHRSEVITSENLQKADLIIVMSRAQQRGLSARVGAATPVIVLGDLDPLPITQRTIVDPWDGEVEVFEQSYERIDRCVRELARIIFGNTVAESPVPRRRMAPESIDRPRQESPG